MKLELHNHKKNRNESRQSENLDARSSNYVTDSRRKG